MNEKDVREEVRNRAAIVYAAQKQREQEQEEEERIRNQARDKLIFMKDKQERYNLSIQLKNLMDKSEETLAANFKCQYFKVGDYVLVKDVIGMDKTDINHEKQVVYIQVKKNNKASRKRGFKPECVYHTIGDDSKRTRHFWHHLQLIRHKVPRFLIGDEVFIKTRGEWGVISSNGRAILDEDAVSVLFYYDIKIHDTHYPWMVKNSSDYFVNDFMVADETELELKAIFDDDEEEKKKKIKKKEKERKEKEMQLYMHFYN